ncbi:MAG: hypothetical protein Q9160_009045 [Pyrenula sp. 1 TL-2023]
MAASRLRPVLLRSHPSPFRRLQWNRASFQQYRQASYQRFPRKRGQYSQRGESSSGPYNSFYRPVWQSNGSKILLVGAVGGTIFYISNLETVPATGRRRFNCISPQTEAQLGQSEYQNVLHTYKSKLLPANHSLTQRVARIVERLLPASGLGDAQWVIHVINDKEQKNAFVLPGGKVFVFSGMIDFAEDDDGLAAVLGHEIAHNVAHHLAERMSNSIIAWVGALAVSYLYGISTPFSDLLSQWIFSLPQGRKQEAEADEIGLSIMAESCFDPQAAYRLWERMQQAEKLAVPQFISTHPSHHNRMEHIQALLPEAEAKARDKGCNIVSNHQTQFQSAFQDFDRGFW